MQAKPIVAIVCVCAAAGVGAWNVHYFRNAGTPAERGPAAPPAMDPGAARVAANGMDAVRRAFEPIGTTEGARAGRAEAPTDLAAAAIPGGSTEPVLAAGPIPGGSTEPAGRGSGEADFGRLFEALVARNAERASASEIPAAAPFSTPFSASEGGGDDGWERLELRGIVVGAERALALVNGRLLRVGDELPGARFRIEQILADRVVASSIATGARRALTLHVFESPNRKVRTSGNPSMPATPTPAAADGTNRGASDPSPSAGGREAAGVGANGGKE